MKKIPIIVIAGPTASGKTAFGIELAKKYNGEIVSYDSMQVYKELSISTAKPTVEEQNQVKHHLIDIVSVTEKYSVARFCNDAKKCVDLLSSQNKNIFFVGGTGLYIDSFVKNIDFTADNTDTRIREKLLSQADELGSDYLYNKLKKLDAEAASKIHPNNVKRVIRALEILEKSGVTKSQQDIKAAQNESIYDVLYLGLNYRKRDLLYNRIDKRVDLMIENGLVDEAKKFFYTNGLSTSVQAIGCKELKPYIDGESLLDDCVDKLKRETRRYAKRQLTWFRRNDNINWFYLDEITVEEAIKSASKLIDKHLCRE